MSNSLTPLVPEKTYAVCTNGMQKGEMVVGSQDNVHKENLCLIATIEDKPTNFACVWAGILIAIVGGLLTALFVSGVGATIGCLLLATLVGILAAHGLGGVVCHFFLTPALWINPHPQILINKRPALIGTSTIVCKPLWFGTGNITLYYSKEVADRVAKIYRWKNYSDIFNAVNLGFALPGFVYNLFSGIFTGKTLQTLGSIALGFGGGEVLGWMQGGAANLIGDAITPLDADFSTSDDPKFNSVYSSEGYSPDGTNIIGGENFFEWPEKIQMAQNFTYANADRSRIMLWRHRVWGHIYKGNSAPLKAAWRWDKQLGPNKNNAQKGIAVFIYGVIGNIAFDAYINSLKNDFMNDLPELETAEMEAIAKVGIFEQNI